MLVGQGFWVLRVGVWSVQVLSADGISAKKRAAEGYAWGRGAVGHGLWRGLVISTTPTLHPLAKDIFFLNLVLNS